MKPRPSPLPVPPASSSRYWTVDVPGKGAHLFRTPYYGVGSPVLDWINRHYVAPENDHRTLQGKTTDLVPLIGAVLGVCWHNRAAELETRVPSELTPDALHAYGLAVVAELEDADYTIPELLDLFTKVKREFDQRISIVMLMSLEKRDFTSPPKEGSISN